MEPRHVEDVASLNGLLDFSDLFLDFASVGLRVPLQCQLVSFRLNVLVEVGFRLQHFLWAQSAMELAFKGVLLVALPDDIVPGFARVFPLVQRRHVETVDLVDVGRRVLFLNTLQHRKVFV